MPVSPNATNSLPVDQTPEERQSGIDLAQSKYDFRYLAFPSDLGMENMGHYMVININVQTNRDDTVAGDPAFKNWSQVIEPLQRSKVDQLRFGATPPSNGGSAPSQRPAVALNRSTRRIQESVALHMPTPIVFNDHNVYEEISLTALGARLGVGAVSSTVGRFLPRGLRNAINNVSQNVGEVAQVLGTPINPMVEVLFANKVVRQFSFEVLMAPRNEYESRTIKDIIKTLRFHSAPEISSAGINLGLGTLGAGLLWIPPAEFDITFFNRGVENMNILRVNTCALERVEVDYAPAGVYSTFRNGHPVAVRMSLAFKELEPIHKLRVAQGF
jgi:hypothetical protein